SSQRSTVQREVDRARTALETALREHDSRLRELGAAVARRPQLEIDLARADAAAARYEALQAEHAQQAQARAASQRERSSLERSRDDLRERFREVIQHRQGLPGGPPGPRCPR